MRCTKCGFVSFDYRSECGKCGTSLSEARDILGFSSTKPEIPFLLGSLLRDYTPSVAEETSAPVPNVSPSFDFGDDLGGFRQVEEFSAVPGASVPDPEEGEEDYSLLDLSDEELELLIDKEPAGGAGKKPDFWLDVDSDKNSSEPASPGRKPEKPVKSESGDPDQLGDLIPRFDFDSLPGLADKTPPAATPEQEFVLAEPEKLKTARATPEESEAPLEIEAAAQSPATTNPSGEAADDFVIELSENDLQNLLLELDSSQKKEGQEEK